MCICVRSLVGEGQKVREMRVMENKNSARDRDGAAGGGRSGDGGSVEISEQWFSLTSGSRVQPLAIDLFKIRSSAIDKLGVLKSPSEPTSASQRAKAGATNRESDLVLF